MTTSTATYEVELAEAITAARERSTESLRPVQHRLELIRFATRDASVKDLISDFGALLVLLERGERLDTEERAT